MEKSCIASRSLFLMKILRTNFLAFALVLGVLLNVDLLDGADHASLSGFSPPPTTKIKAKIEFSVLQIFRISWTTFAD